MNQIAKNVLKEITLIAIIPFLSCNKEINNPIRHFRESQRQVATHSRLIDLEEFDILKPVAAIRKDESYMIWDLNNEKLLHLVDFNTKNVIRGIKKGSGPGEVVAIIDLQFKEDNFFIFDPDRQKINRVYISCDTTLMLKEVEDIDSDKRLFAVNYQGSHLIATGLFEDAWFVSLKKNGEIISKADFPTFEETDNTTGMERSMLYISTHIANKPDKKKVVAATQNFGVLSFFNYINGSILEEYKQIKYYGPKFTLPGRGGIAWSKDGRVGFCGLDCDDEYVYALYSGRTYTEYGMQNHYCEHLLVYDWDGNPVKHYVLDIPLFSMKYDKENNTIYGIGYNPEGFFVEYQL